MQGASTQTSSSTPPGRCCRPSELADGTASGQEATSRPRAINHYAEIEALRAFRGLAHIPVSVGNRVCPHDQGLARCWPGGRPLTEQAGGFPLPRLSFPMPFASGLWAL